MPRRGVDLFLEEVERYIEITEWHRRKIRQAYIYAKDSHRGQFRDGGERYFNHPKTVALMYLELCAIAGKRPEANGVIAALLHDVIEDCPDITTDDITAEFNQTVGTYVDALTNRRGESAAQLQERLARASDTAKLIKFADRLHNVSTLNECRVSKRVKKLRETEQVIVPLVREFDPKIADMLIARMEQVEV